MNFKAFLQKCSVRMSRPIFCNRYEFIKCTFIALSQFAFPHLAVIFCFSPRIQTKKWFLFSSAETTRPKNYFNSRSESRCVI